MVHLFYSCSSIYRFDWNMHAKNVALLLRGGFHFILQFSRLFCFDSYAFLFQLKNKCRFFAMKCAGFNSTVRHNLQEKVHMFHLDRVLATIPRRSDQCA